MTIDWVHAMFIDHHGDVSLADLAQTSSFSEEELRELVECGAFAYVERAPFMTFSARCVFVARAA